MGIERKRIENFIYLKGNEMGKSILLGCTCYEAVTKAWKKQGFTVLDKERELGNLSYEEMLNELKEQIEKNNIEIVFTFSFYPDLAKACNVYNVMYISWIWDCPHATLWAKEARFDTNRIFVFDYSQYNKLCSRGLNNVYYMPLATDIEWFDKIICSDSEKHKDKYSADVTFLGNFYNDSKHDLYSQISYLPPYVEGYLNGMIAAQTSIWGADLLDTGITEDVWKELKKYIIWDVNGRYEADYFETVFKNILGQHIAKLERMEMCSRLAKEFDFALYTDCDTSFDKGIVNKGHADYLTEMPLIFKYSKINIHMTIRSIPTGVALRVLDVLACGGFLLTNYQDEIAEYFADGTELVIYSDLDDMCDKIRYYLEHDEEREQIAKAGQAKVRELFSYDTRISDIAMLLRESEGIRNE